jgi:hypothetical protein
MGTCIRKVVTATAAILALALLLPAPASAQNPPNCNANLLEVSISSDRPPCSRPLAGEVINYSVGVTNHSLTPANCTPCTPAEEPSCTTPSPSACCNCQVGCDISNATADFCCPDPTGNPATPPDPLCTNLFTGVDIPAGTSAPGSPFGPFACIMPDIGPGIALAGVIGDGLLDDGTGPGGGPEPFSIDKMPSVGFCPTTSTTTSTTTTTTSSTTTTTTFPAVCLTRGPGFWGNHPFLIESNDPRSLDLLPLEVCGTTLVSTSAGGAFSTTEAICSVGTDGKILGPQLTQLVRQCTTALLNVAASTTLDGSCGGAFPGLDELLTGCCGDASVCTGDTVPGLSVGKCIDRLDAFINTTGDTLNFPFQTGPADSSICRASKGNGVVVSPTPGGLPQGSGSRCHHEPRRDPGPVGWILGIHLGPATSRGRHAMAQGGHRGPRRA